METILLSGGSKENSRLLLQLARKLNFRARKLTMEEIEDAGLLISIEEGLNSGLLNESDKAALIKDLKSKPADEG